MNTQEANQRPLFPHLLTQCFNPPVIPQIGANNPRLQAEQHEFREYSQKLPLTQVKEVQTPILRQLPHQRSCQDVRMDPCYQKPLHYSQIQHH